MKEFEKWYNENWPNYPPSSSPKNFVFHRSAYNGWKAALEWWSGKEVIGGNVYTDGNIRFADVDTRIKLIREELGI